MSALPDEAASILKALENQDYDWRTIDGISSETGLPRDKVRLILNQLSDKVVQSSQADSTGRSLFTTRAKYYAHLGLANRILTVLTDRIR